jgi:hypothetical protein
MSSWFSWSFSHNTVYLQFHSYGHQGYETVMALIWFSQVFILKTNDSMSPGWHSVSQGGPEVGFVKSPKMGLGGPGGRSRQLYWKSQQCIRVGPSSKFGRAPWHSLCYVNYAMIGIISASWRDLFCGQRAPWAVGNCQSPCIIVGLRLELHFCSWLEDCMW